MRPTLLFIALVGCGSQEKTPATPPPSEETQPDAGPAEEDAGAPVVQGVTTWGEPGKDPPRLASDAGDVTSVSGGLVPDVIARIVHLNRARFRTCYAAGVQRNASLGGRVVVHFVIARTGGVAKAMIDPTATTLPDESVNACIADAFKQLSFPQPEGGEVGITYPLVFTPAH